MKTFGLITFLILLSAQYGAEEVISSFHSDIEITQSGHPQAPQVAHLAVAVKLESINMNKLF